jgi:hypothetical protein
MSNTVSILAAQIPDVPAAPTTVFNDAADTLTINWVAPDARGSPIISYEIYFRQADETTFTLQLTDCNG